MRICAATAVVVFALAVLVPADSASGVADFPATGCEAIAMAAVPGMADLAVRRAVQCALPARLGNLLVAAPEGLWANTWDGTLVRLDRRTFAVTATAGIPYVQGIVLRDDGLWALAQGMQLVEGNRNIDVLDLVHVDRSTGAILSTIRLPLAAMHSSDDQAYLATTLDTLWVAQANVPLVAAINPRDGSVIATVALPGRTEAMGANDATVWVEVWADDYTGSRLVSIDAASNSITTALSCECGGIGRSSKLVVTKSDAWFSGSALTHVDLATGAITTQPRRVTGGLTSAGTDLWAIGPIMITNPTVDGPWGLVTRIAPGSSEATVGAIVPTKPRFDSLGPITTIDGQTLFALRNRRLPAHPDRAAVQTMVRLTLRG